MQKNLEWHLYTRIHVRVPSHTPTGRGHHIREARMSLCAAPVTNWLMLIRSRDFGVGVDYGRVAPWPVPE